MISSKTLRSGKSNGEGAQQDAQVWPSVRSEQTGLSTAPASQLLSTGQHHSALNVEKRNAEQDAEAVNTEIDQTKVAQSYESTACIDPTANLDYTESIRLQGWHRQYFRLAHQCARVRDWITFQNSINLAILVASIMVGVQAVTPNQPQGMIILDEIIGFVFLFEVLIKIIAEGFRPIHFFADSWNKLDFCIVVSTYTPAGGAALLFRMVRLLRVLKVLRVFPKLRMLVMALTNSFSSINFVVIVMFLVFYMFSIFGMMLFENNDPFHWENLHVSIMTMFRVATGDDWTDIMYTAQFGCDVYPAHDYTRHPELCDPTKADGLGHPEAWGVWSVIFFVMFFILGGLVFLNLFIGVIAASMAQSMDEVKQDDTVHDRVVAFQELYALKDSQIRCLRTAFDSLDLDHSGRVDLGDIELVHKLLHLQPSREQFVDLLQASMYEPDQLDIDGLLENGSEMAVELDLCDFVKLMIHPDVAGFDSMVKNHPIGSDSVSEESQLVTEFLQQEEERKQPLGI